MNWLRGGGTIGIVLALAFVLTGCGKMGIQPQITAEVVMTAGDKIRLFHGGTQAAKDLFCAGETVSIYRAYPQERLRYVEVGKARIVRPIDEHYLEGIIVEGNVKEGDLARKGIAACLVVPLAPSGKPPE